MIRKPTESGNKKHILIIAGVPGIGKTTLALSAPDPLLINTDDGYEKVKVVHRVSPHITPLNYEEIRDDLHNEDLGPYETLVFDTAGTLIELMKTWVAKNPRYVQRDGRTLSQKGYGAVKQEFADLMNHCRYTLQKHIVLIFHTTETREGDRTIIRLDISGSSGNFAWKIADLGGMLFVESGKRIINFSPEESHHAKGAYGIHGSKVVPETDTTESNDFLAKLFAEAARQREEERKIQVEYEKLMKNVNDLIDGITDLIGIQDACENFSSFTWILSANREAWAMLVKKADSLGISWNREKKEFEYKQKEKDAK